MAENSKIEWTDATWNPVRGCSRVSEGCRNCYAEKVAARFSGPGMPYEGLAVMKDGKAHWTGEVRLIEEHLNDPLKWRKPRRIFVNSMSDLFHESLTYSQIARVFAVMWGADHHTYQILTKRAEHMYRWATTYEAMLRENGRRPLSEWRQVHLGVSVEDQKTADERIPLLLQTPAALRFLSVEPLLGPVDLLQSFPALGCSTFVDMDERTGEVLADGNGMADIGWVIVGGESGPGARACNIENVRLIVEQCRAAGVPCFVKQLGAKPVDWRSDEPEVPPYEFYLSDRKGGDINEWPEDLRVRQFPTAVGRAA